MANALEDLIKKIQDAEGGLVQLNPKEIRMIRTGLRMWDAIDSVLDIEIDLDRKNYTIGVDLSNSPDQTAYSNKLNSFEEVSESRNSRMKKFSLEELKKASKGDNNG